MKPVEGYVRPILRPYEESIANIILRAWETWWKSSSKKTYRYARVRACAVHELMVREARKAFALDRDVHIIDGQETIYVMFKRAVVIRFKKGDRRGLGQNNPTQASLAFITASADVHVLPLGIPDVHRVDVTYILNALETRIDQILVIGRDGARLLWKYGVYPRAVAPIAVLPVRPIAPASPADVVRVPSRKVEKKDTK
jgi:hypothetical protein